MNGLSIFDKSVHRAGAGGWCDTGLQPGLHPSWQDTVWIRRPSHNLVETQQCPRVLDIYMVTKQKPSPRPWPYLLSSYGFSFLWLREWRTVIKNWNETCSCSHRNQGEAQIDRKLGWKVFLKNWSSHPPWLKLFSRVLISLRLKSNILNKTYKDSATSNFF